METRASSRAPRTVHLAVDHPRIRSIDRDVFLVTFAADCGEHRCLCRDDGDKPRADACCQHGADVHVPEKAAILRRAAEVASVLKPAWTSPERWFDERDPEEDPEAPLGILLRTATTDLEDDSSGCVFLENQGPRGCGLHMAAVKHGFDPAEIKPAVCRLYPLSFGKGRIGLSPDFYRYSCATSGSTTLYHVLRSTLEGVFGAEAVTALDQVDAKVRARNLKVLR